MKSFSKRRPTHVLKTALFEPRYSANFRRSRLVHYQNVYARRHSHTELFSVWQKLLNGGSTKFLRYQIYKAINFWLDLLYIEAEVTILQSIKTGCCLMFTGK